METIHLEGYSASLRKQKIYCVGDIQNLDKMFYGLFSQYSDEMLRRHKVVVLFCDQYIKHQPKFLKNMYIDATFRIRDNLDLRLAYTYIQHTSKPLIVLWYGNEVPIQMFGTKDDITLISGGQSQIIHTKEYTSIFWHSKSTYEEMKDILMLKLKNVDVKTILNETKASDVSLMWSSIGDSLYWFDFNSIKSNNPVINYTQACEYLRHLADALENKDS